MSPSDSSKTTGDDRLAAIEARLTAIEAQLGEGRRRPRADRPGSPEERRAAKKARRERAGQAEDDTAESESGS